MTQRARQTSRRAARAEMVVATEALLDVRDDLAAAVNLVAATYLASLGLQTGERAALCAVSDAARERLVAVAAALDTMLGAAAQEPPR